MSKLTPRQRRFVEAYTGNATQAAISAGYSAKTATTQGSRLFRNAHVQRAIEKRAATLARGLTCDRIELLERLTEKIRDDSKPDATHIKAIDTFAKIEGYARVKVEIQGSLTLLDLVRESMEKPKNAPGGESAREETQIAPETPAPDAEGIE